MGRRFRPGRASSHRDKDILVQQVPASQIKGLRYPPDSRVLSLGEQPDSIPFGSSRSAGSEPRMTVSALNVLHSGRRSTVPPCVSYSWNHQGETPKQGSRLLGSDRQMARKIGGPQESL